MRVTRLSPRKPLGQATSPCTMFETSEYEFDPKVAQRIPLLEGQNFPNMHNDDQLIQARVERPILPKDVLELRSAQARTLDVSGCIWGENHRLIGRRVFATDLAGIPEDILENVPGSSNDDARSMLSVGGATARDLVSNISTGRITIGSHLQGPCTSVTPSPRPTVTSGTSFVVLTEEESLRYLGWADVEDLNE